MLYVTGDTHGDFKRFTKAGRARLPFALTEEDSCIVCGDFGLLWEKGDALDYDLKWLSSLPFRILWVQGNHENYDIIAEYPLEEWNGGKVRHIVRDRIILLERGQVFCLEGKRVFAFGGASSHDVDGGILDRSSPNFREEARRACRSGLAYRILRESWWPEELPCEEELEEGLRNLERAGYEVDYVITHCASDLAQKRLAEHYGIDRWLFGYPPDRLTEFFDQLEERLRFRRWYFGHYHDDVGLGEKHCLLYRAVRPLGT